MAKKFFGRRFLPPLILSGMMACIALSAAQFVQIVAPDWNSPCWSSCRCWPSSWRIKATG